MAYTCETCGKVMQSEGSFGLHQLTAHVAGAAVPPSAIPAGGQWGPPAPAGAYGQVPDPYTRYSSPPQHKANPLVVIFGAIGVTLALVVAGSLVAITVFGTKAKPAQVALVDPASPPPLPADFRHVVKADDGFLIGVPASFEEVPLSAEDMRKVADNLEGVNPRLAAGIRESYQMVSADRLFAIDQSSGNNQQVQRIVIDGAGTIEDVPPGMFTEEYRNKGVDDVREERVHLPAGDALKVTANLNVGLGQVLVTQHVLVRDSTVWVLSYAQDAGGDSSMAATIASTFAWTK
jgi:hypothetical protein